MAYVAVVVFGQDAWSQERVHFPSFAPDADGSAVTLDGYLYRPRLESIHARACARFFTRVRGNDQ